MTRRAFPEGFLWGVATSAYQIEGAAREGGRGESIWDRFAAAPGRIADGSDGSVACDHYHRWREDVELMRGLGLGAYRFSIAWPRVLPHGRGTVNSSGLDFYDALVDALLEAGLRPFVTLNHWDLPQALQEAGGWASRETARAFVEYAAAVSMRLGDRVKDWATHNEPWCIATLGHEAGVHAPGHRDPAEALRAAHHLLLSHGWAVPALRRNSPGARVGLALNLVPAYPASPSDADREATRRFDGTFNRWYLDPVFRGTYPADAVDDLARAGRPLPGVEAGDLAAIAAPVDWLGLNYYSRAVVRSDEIPEPENAPRTVHQAPRREWTAMGWEIFPQGLHDLAVRIHREYAPAAMYVTENGAAFDSQPAPGEPAADARRIDFIRGHLQAAHRAIADGVPLAGYFHWSLVDNFEWQHGYTKRFGLVWVDYPTQRRVPKGSARWYREVVAANAIDDDVPNAARRSA
jgi:beta-glucosidase